MRAWVISLYNAERFDEGQIGAMRAFLEKLRRALAPRLEEGR